MALKQENYWARKQGEEFVKEVRLKVKRYFEACEQQGLLTQWREKYNTYFMQKGRRGLARADSTILDLGTRKNPDVQIHIPELRSLCRQQLAFLLAEPISFQVVSATGSTRSVMGSEVGEKAVNYVYAEHIKPTQLDLAENFIVYGAAASHLRWDRQKGDDVIETHQVPVTQPRIDPNTQQPMTGPDGQPIMDVVPEQSKDDNGQPRFNQDGSPVPLTDDRGQIVPKLQILKRPGKSGAPYRDALDPTMFAYDPLIGPRANWAVAFERTNLYVLASKFPEYAEEILKQNCRDEYEPYRLNLWQDMYGADEGDCMIMHVYYADSAEMPKGRYTVIVGNLAIEQGECPLPAGRLPVRLIVNSKYTDCYLSFADSSCIMPIEEALNKIRSSSLKNIAYYGDQTRWQQTGSKVVSGEGQGSAGRGGQRIIEGPAGSAPPQMLQINPMPAAAPQVMDEFLAAMPRISGFSDISRGRIEDTTSGAHAAVFEAITARNLSLPQAQIVEHETAEANDTLELMQRFGNVEFIVEIAGKGGSPIAQAFAPEDLSSIRRLVAKAVPDAMRGPLARTKLVELTKDIQDPREKAKAVQMILRGDDEYGRVDARRQNLISVENEWMLSGESPATAAASDDHYGHNVDHEAALAEYRAQPNADPQVIARFLTHIQQHNDLLQVQDPVLARTLGYQEPPVLPDNPAFKFQQRMLQAQSMLQQYQASMMPPPPPSTPGKEQPQQQQQPPAAA